MDSADILAVPADALLGAGSPDMVTSATSEESAWAIDAVGLSKRYGRRWALIDVGFRLPAGSTLLIAGRNGSGKSTLLRVLSSAIRPDAGSARIAGVDLRDVERVRKSTALLSHYSYTYDSLSAIENLRIVAGTLGTDATRAVLTAALDEVGLSARADDPVMNFSAGMRKRLALARALLQNPRVILLDEPYGQLDPPGFRLIDEIVARLRKRNATIVIATHHLERSSRLADYALVLERGRLEWSGAAMDLPKQAFEDEVTECI